MKLRSKRSRRARAKQDGTVASAAEVVAAYPDVPRSRRPPESAKERTAQAPTARAKAPQAAPIKPHPAMVQALTKAFEAVASPDAVETSTALVDAVGALGLLNLKPQVQADCTSDNPTLREHAEKRCGCWGSASGKSYSGQRMPVSASWTPRSPRRLGSSSSRMWARSGSSSIPSLLRWLPHVSRSSCARVSSDVVIHRVVPGFVVQFGDPGGDGYGGAGRPSLRCETSPLRYEALSWRRPRGSRHRLQPDFVTLGAFPHLDGDYALIGRAEPGWDRVAEGT